MMRVRFLAVTATVVLGAASGAGLVPALSWADMSAGATCAVQGTSLQLSARDTKFDKDCLAVPGGKPFTIAFENKDTSQHNVVILPNHGSTETLFRGELFAGPKTMTYSVGPLAAGTYHFHCETHPTQMMGTFIVAAATDGAPAAGGSTTPTPGPKVPFTPVAASAPGGSSAASAPSPSGPTTPTPGPKVPFTPVAASAPETAATAPSPAAGAPRAAAAAAATAPTAVGSTSSAANPGSPAAASAAATTSPLPRTGPHSRILILLAGLALSVGGATIFGAARRPATKH